MTKASPRNRTLLNRTARKEFAVADKVVCGVVLSGSEVKQIRAGKADITASYARVLIDPKSKRPELWLMGMSVAGSENKTTYKLLVTREQLKHLIGEAQQKQQTLVATRSFFSHGYFKVELGLAKRLKKHDRRAKERAADQKREIARVVRR